MNVIITGGTGLIGRPLAQMLVEQGHRVWVLSRSAQPQGLPAGVETAQWDGRTSRGWENLVEQADAIVNLAGENIGELPWTNERKQKIRASRVDVGLAITRAIEAASRRPRVLVQASGVGFYGPHGGETVTEEDRFGGDFLSSVAVDWEASTRGVEDLGVRRVVARLGVYLSPKGGALQRFLLPWKMFIGGPMGSGSQWLPWIHPADALGAMAFLMQNEQLSGPYNLAAPNPVTNAEFGRTLAQVLKKPFWAPIPGFALRLLLGEMSTMVLEGQRAVPARLLDAGYVFRYEALRPALEDLLAS